MYSLEWLLGFAGVWALFFLMACAWSAKVKLRKMLPHGDGNLRDEKEAAVEEAVRWLALSEGRSGRRAAGGSGP